MRIRFEQSGGFAGLTKMCEIDASELSSDAKSALAGIDFGPGFESVLVNSQKRDESQLKLTFENDGESRTIEWAGGAVPASIRPLVSELKKRARPVQVQS